jgi:hypothetical protein
MGARSAEGTETDLEINLELRLWSFVKTKPPSRITREQGSKGAREPYVRANELLGVVDYQTVSLLTDEVKPRAGSGQH